MDQAQKFFHKFPEAVFDVVAWNRYDTLTASGRGHSTDNTIEPGQKVHNYRSDHWTLSNCFTSFRMLFSMELHGIGTTERRRPVGPNPSTTLENRVKRSITIDLTVGSRSNCFTSFRRLFLMELLGIGMTRRRRPVGAIPPTTLDNPIKRSKTIDPTVGSR